MEILLYILIAVAGIIALFFIIKKLAGCLLKIVLVVAVLAVVAGLFYLLVMR